MARLPAWSVDRPGHPDAPRPFAPASLSASSLFPGALSPGRGATPRRAGLWAGWLARRLAPLAPPPPNLAEPAR
ncbi:hypothetical protein QE401_000754 [Pseudoroseomonas cervicalis]|nr:hypothetical protein [Pseudoroseomonas cervicalis]